MHLRLLAPLLVAVATFASPAAAKEVTPAEKRAHPYVAELPTCGDPAVLATITSRFAEKEAGYWNSSLTIVEYAQIRPLAWRPGGLDLIPRRFCSANATISDGRRHRVDYSVREDLGFIGADWGIEWCVVGFDRNWAFQPACRMSRP